MSEAKRDADGRYICTRETPWSHSIPGRVVHPDAVDDGECFDGCCDYWKCPNCGHRWKTEVPQ